MDDDFGFDGFDDFGDYDEFNDFDATSCANGDYNAWEEEQVFRDEVLERQDDADAHVEDLYGDDAFCEWCRDDGEVVVGRPVGRDYMGDILGCPECGHEWVVVPGQFE